MTVKIYHWNAIIYSVFTDCRNNTYPFHFSFSYSKRNLIKMKYLWNLKTRLFDECSTQLLMLHFPEILLLLMRVRHLKASQPVWPLNWNSIIATFLTRDGIYLQKVLAAIIQMHWSKVNKFDPPKRGSCLAC